MVGSVLSARNDVMLNAGPSAWLVWTGDNGDIKFPHKIPIIPETHEEPVLLYDQKHSECVSAVCTLNMLYDLQAAQSMAAGYFGGYTSKMQDVGKKELQRLREALERKVDREHRKPLPKAFQEYSKRLLKDLESRSVVRTAVENLNLAIHGDKVDVMSAECIRTFPSVSFPAAELLRREEIETQKAKGASIIVAVHHARGEGLRTWTAAPFDLLYGFRGMQDNVDLMSPYEMLRYWALERILPPTKDAPNPSSRWTEEGKQSARRYHATGESVELKAGVHYVALEAPGRILLPELEALRGLRHRWFWCKRERPYVPVWNFAKLPRNSLPAEENCRLLSIYMRPWTLYDQDATTHTPLLTDLRVRNDIGDTRKTYMRGWQTYVAGNVVTDMQRRYIQNLLMATTARVSAKIEETSSDESDFEYNRNERDIGDMDVAQKTIEGLAANDEELGSIGFGNHSNSIALGRSLWQTDVLTPSELQTLAVAQSTYEVSAENAKKAMAMHATQHTHTRTAPFSGATQPMAISHQQDYKVKFDAWFQRLCQEKEQPTTEQITVLKRVRDRLLTEVELLTAPRHTRNAVNSQNLKGQVHDPREEPLRGLIAGCPGTGKSRVIKWIIRLFVEVMGWTGGVEFDCVAFQNRVAFAMHGSTLHTAGQIKIGEQSYSAMLEHTDIDTLFTKNQHLRWVVFDEVFMIPDDLLGIANLHDPPILGAYFANLLLTFVFAFIVYFCLFLHLLFDLLSSPSKLSILPKADN